MPTPSGFISGLYGSPTPPSSLPFSSDAHRSLNDLFQTGHIQRAGRFSHTARAYVLRQLFHTIWQRPEWVALFGLEGEKVPQPKSLSDWLLQDENGGEKSWSLAEVQKRADARGVRMGKAPLRVVKPGRTCGKVLQRFERTYTCKTCAIDQSSVLCVDCFHAADHEGHEVLFGQSFSFAAGCDCGDPTAWRDDEHLGCLHHPPVPSGSNAPSHPPGFITDDSRIPPALSKAMYETIVLCLEFIIQVLQYGPSPAEYGNLPKDEIEMRLAEENTGEAREKRGKGPWSVVLWADEKHVAKEVTRQIRDALGVSWETAERYAKEVEEVVRNRILAKLMPQGRKVMVTSSNPISAFHTASMFQQIDLGVTLRSAADTFKEEIVGMLISWLADMCQCAVGGDGDLFKRLVARALNEPRMIKGPGHGTPIPSDLRRLDAPSESKRIDWLMQLDVRLWKKGKWELRSIYAGLYCLNWDVRKDLALHFAINYIPLFEHYLFQDRDIDSNLIFCISYMVFGNGRACTYASTNGELFETVLDVAHAWYTNQVVNGHLTLPPAENVPSEGSETAQLDTDSPAFRGKKGITVFGHMRALFRHEEMQRLIVRSPAMFTRTVNFLNMFVGLQTQRKEDGGHIEFEVDWPRSFAILGELAKCCREFGEAYQYADLEKLLADIAIVATRIMSDMMLMSSTLDRTRYAQPVMADVENVLVRGSRHTLIKENVSQIEAFSFHHYMNLLLAEMLKAVRKVIGFSNGQHRGADLRSIFESTVLKAQGAPDVELMKLLLVEYPMQKHVVLSQIRADMWKKNGVAMRGQYHHYREMGVREATLDQEFFLLQFGLCIIDPFKFMVALIDRFGLSEFYGGDVLSSAIWENKDADPKQRIAMLEDFVLLIIHLVSDSATVNGWDQDRITRKHIVHQLVLHNLTYSELVKKLPERSTDRGSILPFLEDIADFKEPTETANGSYTLKVECYDEVDPYWRHYSRNDQRVALEKLTNRAKKLDSDTAEPLVLPRPLEIPEQGRPFSNLADFLHTHVVAEMVHWTIAHCMVIADPMQWPGLTANKNEAPQLETLLDLGLHLTILALSVAPKEFAETSVDIIEASGSMSTFQNLWYMQTTEAFKPFRPKIDHILSIIVTSLPESYTTDYRAQREQEKNAMKSPDKPDPRLAAGARQKVIMAEFARKQADFAALMDEAVEEEDIAEDVTTVTYGQCIVCQDDVTMKSTGGMLALLQPSRVLRDVVHERDWFEESLLAPTSLDEATRCPRYGQGTSGEPTSTDGYPSANLRFGVYMSACSHLMHESCMATYFDATRYRHTQQVQRHHPENAVRMEYLCPLCKSLGNVLIPLDPSQSRMKAFNTPSSTKGGRPPTLSERIRSVSEEGLIKISESARIWDHHVETGELVPWFSDCNFSVHTLDPINRRQQMRGTSRMIERMRNLLRPLSEQSQRVRSKKTHMYLPDDVVGYTVAVCEVAQRGLQLTQGLTVAEQVPEMSTRLIERLIGMLQLELDLFFGPKYDRTALRVGIFARFLPDWYRASTLPSPLLLRQPLGIVIEAAAIAPDLLQAVIVMAYYAELTRCMLGLSIFAKRCLAARTAAQPRSRPIKEILASDAHSVFFGFRSIMQSVLRNAGPFTDTDGVLALLSDEMLSKLLYAHTLPFLRRCAIVYHAVAGGYPVTNTDLIVSDGCEYNRLLSLMGIPRPKETLQNPHSIETPIVARWLTQWAMQGRIVPPLEYPGTYELCRLPKLWEDVVLRYSEQRCDNCGTKPTFPALCLYCGKFLCLGGDCCADGEQGECNLHMRECGAVVGMFVDIKRWVLLYLYAGSGSFGHMPYLDSHGELDISMRRGHRQYMHLGRMDELRRATWLQHAIPHLTARRLELTSDGGGWGCL